MNSIESLLLNNTASIVTTGGFLFYLIKKDKETNNMINNHLKSSAKVIRENTNSRIKMVKTLQELCDYIKRLNGNLKKQNEKV